MQALQQKQLANQQLRDLLEGGAIREQTIEERVERCKDKQYKEHEQLFAVLYSSIHKAACDNSILGIKHFLGLKKPRVHIDDFDKNGICPIHYAAERGHVDTVKFIIENGCDINLKTTYGNSAMMYACKENRLEIIQLLFDGGAKLNIRNKAGMNGIHLAAQSDNVDSIQLIVDLSCHHHQKKMEMLLEHKDKENDETVMIQPLTPTNKKPKDDREDDDSISLGSAIIKKQTSSLNQDTHNLLNQLSNNMSSPLHLACLANSYRCVEYLLQQGVSVNVQDSAGDTPLHKAGRMQKFPIYKLLIAYGASEGIKNNLRETPADLLKDDVNY